MNTNTCGQCRHWHQLPSDPNNIGLRAGECRESLHLIGLPNPVTRSFDIRALYAQIEAEFPACSHFDYPSATPALLPFPRPDSAEGEQD